MVTLMLWNWWSVRSSTAAIWFHTSECSSSTLLLMHAWYALLLVWFMHCVSVEIYALQSERMWWKLSENKLQKFAPLGVQQLVTRVLLKYTLQGYKRIKSAPLRVLLQRQAIGTIFALFFFPDNLAYCFRQVISAGVNVG